MELELGEFDPSLGSATLTLANREHAVYAACKHQLLGCREAALAALRAGFTLQPNEGASAAAGKHALPPYCRARRCNALREAAV